jgi:hypothetical protein
MNANDRLQLRHQQSIDQDIEQLVDLSIDGQMDFIAGALDALAEKREAEFFLALGEHQRAIVLLSAYLMHKQITAAALNKLQEKLRALDQDSVEPS